MLQCAVNVSEGRRPDVVDALTAACGEVLVDVHVDPDHHRSVFTLVAEAPSQVAAAAFRLARVAIERIDLAAHQGVHPRLGAVDVVPFANLDPGVSPEMTAGREAAAATASIWAQRAAAKLGVPVFLYGDADPEGRSLPEVRRDAFVRRTPDFGPAGPDPRSGAVAVGARPVMVALNCELASGDLAVARDIARAVRERDGGLPGVRALGFLLASRGRAQVSMNLVELAATGIEAACSAVRQQARQRGTDVAAVELVGLVPAAELARCSTGFVAWSGLSTEQTIEDRVRRRR